MRIPALAGRAAVVTTCATAAALLISLPTPAVSEPPTTPVQTTVVPVAATSVASTAVNYALSKIGSPYQWGAAGPSAFDCSGLVYWAYRQAGKVLPRTSRAQATVGTPVAKSDLRPGDLVFYYQPISHVGIYIGNGKIVHASTYGTPVKVADVNSMPFTTARRV